LLAARAHARERDPIGAETAAIAGVEAARSLGHVWLELRLFSLLAAQAPSKGYAAQFAARLEAVTAGLPEEMRARLRESWSARGC
jgi:hypothetical protein